MGVPGLWSELLAGSKVVSLTALALDEIKTGKGFRVGIDVSIWLFHAEYGREGENPQLRTIFFRCASLLNAPFLPIFVFDGPHRPDIKRNKLIDKAPNALVDGIQRILEAFGYHWITAPGEAEAELAYLNSAGFIDGIWSDDVDTFIFGATTVMRNPSNTLTGNSSNPVLNAKGKDDKNHVRIYRASSLPFTRADLILIALLNGGDYNTAGLDRCGMKTAIALCKCGFGKSLFNAYTTMSAHDFRSAFLPEWRRDLIYQLQTDSQGHIGKKLRALANSIPDSFPDIDILHAYSNPVTSLSSGRKEGIDSSHYKNITFDRDPSIPGLARVAERYFEWGYLEKIVYRYRTIMWHGYLMRILRRQILADEPNCLTKPTAVTFIRKHFSAITQQYKGSRHDKEDFPGLLGSKIHSERCHASTDFRPEYRVTIHPEMLVALTKAGVCGERQPETKDVWSDPEVIDDQNDADEEERINGKKPLKKALPHDELRVWVPAEVLERAEPFLVAEYQRIKKEKEEKKRSKGKGKSASSSKPCKTSKQTKTVLAKTTVTSQSENGWLSEEEGFVSPNKSRFKSKSASTIEGRPFSEPAGSRQAVFSDRTPRPFPMLHQYQAAEEEEESSAGENEEISNSPSKHHVPPRTPSVSPQKSTNAPRWLSSDEDLPIKSPPKSPRKSREQTSPRHVHRNASPTPLRQTPARPRSENVIVVNISSSEDEAPIRNTPRDRPRVPLLMAQKRLAAAKKTVPPTHGVIDLT